MVPQFDRARSFSEGLAAVEIGSRWGYVDKKGRYTINLQFVEVHSFSDGLASIISDKGPGYIDKTGKYIWSPRK